MILDAIAHFRTALTLYYCSMSNTVKTVIALLVVLVLAGGVFAFIKWRQGEPAGTPPPAAVINPDPMPSPVPPELPIVPDPAPVPPRTGRAS